MKKKLAPETKKSTPSDKPLDQTSKDPNKPKKSCHCKRIIHHCAAAIILLAALGALTISLITEYNIHNQQTELKQEIYKLNHTRGQDIKTIKKALELIHDKYKHLVFQHEGFSQELTHFQTQLAGFNKVQADTNHTLHKLLNAYEHPQNIAKKSIMKINMGLIKTHFAMAKLALQNRDKAMAIEQIAATRESLELFGEKGTNQQQKVNLLIKKLRALPQINIVAISHNLQLLNSKLLNLSFKNPISIKKELIANEKSLTKNTKSTWRTALAHAWAKIKSFLVINSNNSIGRDLMFYSAKKQAVQTISLFINQAQVALLNSDTILYKTSLHQAIIYAHKYLKNDNAAQLWIAHATILFHEPISYKKLVISSQ